jgi:hypothetical protein
MEAQSPIYLLSAIAAACGLWFLWTLGLKPLFLHIFRERLFEIRFRLFKLGMTGELPFDSDAYRAMEALICGLLRFGHRITFPTYVLSSIEQNRARKEDRDYVDVAKQISLKVSRLKPVTQQKIAAILSDARSAVLLYIAFTSLIFMALAAVMTVAKWCGIWRPNKAKLSSPVEQEVYRAELRRRPLQPVAA